MVKAKHDVAVLEKCPTGIKGLDEITRGGASERQANPDLRRCGFRQNTFRH